MFDPLPIEGHSVQSCRMNVRLPRCCSSRANPELFSIGKPYDRLIESRNTDLVHRRSRIHGIKPKRAHHVPSRHLDARAGKKVAASEALTPFVSGVIGRDSLYISGTRLRSPSSHGKRWTRSQEGLSLMRSSNPLVDKAYRICLRNSSAQ